MNIAIYIMIALIATMICFIIGLIIKRSLPLWRSESGQIWRDLKDAAFVAWIAGKGEAETITAAAAFGTAAGATGGAIIGGFGTIVAELRA